MSDLFITSPAISFPIADIIIPIERQRKQARADEALLQSIRQNGLFNPIIIHTDGTLVAGERRLDAFRQLNETHILVRMFEDLTPMAAHLIELQENLAREQLTWQEQTAAIASYHEMRKAGYQGWTSMGTASDLGFSEGYISKVIAVARYLEDEEVRGAATFNGAYNLIDGRANRTLAAAQARGIAVADGMSRALPKIIPADATREEKTAMLLEGMQDSVDNAGSAAMTILEKLDNADLAQRALRESANVERATSADERIIHASFLDWAGNYSGPLFDVIHCDFPYGKDYTGSNTRRTGRATTTPLYADTADIYFALVDTLLAEQDRLLLPQAHCIFWFDMKHYCWTVEQFRAAGWNLVQPFPLLWTKNYQGVAADPQRRPRHCYETALMFSRGDRLIRKLDKDHFEETVDEKLHTSQKPLRMLRHFLQLVVDEHTAVLDPTCGSGSALAAASQLGAARILGVELEESNVDIARFFLEREIGNAGKA